MLGRHVNRIKSIIHTRLQRNITIRPVAESHQYLVDDPEFHQFVDEMNSRFGGSRDILLQNRSVCDSKLSLRQDTAHIRNDMSWMGAETPPDLKDRFVEITGPLNDTKMVVNALNSGANGYMGDMEDSLSPSWSNIIGGMDNVYQAVRNKLQHKTDAKTYKLEDTFHNSATFHLRPRGLHLNEGNVVDDDGNPISAMIWDICSHLYHNHTVLNGCYFYLPKLETYEESEWVAKLLKDSHDFLGYSGKNTKVTALIETLPAIYQSEEIIYGLRDYLVGLNCGRWDYLYSFIQHQRRNSDLILPDRRLLTMDQNFLQDYIRKIVDDCNRRNVTPMGGMSAYLPSKDQTQNKQAMSQIIRDKQLEKRLGVKGAWVAHPRLVYPVRSVFSETPPPKNSPPTKNYPSPIVPISNSFPILDTTKPRPLYHSTLVSPKSDIVDPQDTNSNTSNSDIKQPAVKATLPSYNLTSVSSDILQRHNYTIGGLHDNLSVAIKYLDRWLNGTGAVAINGMMEDMATAEISCHQVKQWTHHGVLLKMSDGSYQKATPVLVTKCIDRLVPEASTLTRKLIRQYILDSDETHLSTFAYPYLDRQHGFKGIEFHQRQLTALQTDYSIQSGVEITKHRGNFLTDFLYHSDDSHSYYQFLGTSSGISAVNVVAGGKGRVGPYSGGWQANAMKNRLGECLPDTLHVVPEEPADCAMELNNHLIRADAIQQNTETVDGVVNYQDIAMLADLEQGWSVPEKVRMSVKRCIQNGVNVIHIEDQGERKRCGHLGDKELATLEDYKIILRSANLAAQEVLGSEQAHNQWVRFVARTDAYSAKRIVNSANLHNPSHLEYGFIDWVRGASPDGKYLYLRQGINPETGNTWGLDLSIHRGIEVVRAGLASHVWMETPDADLSIAKSFIEGVNRGLESDGLVAHGLYNHSPSFDWDLKFFQEAEPLVNSIMDWVKEQSYSKPSINGLRDHLAMSGDQVQGDHLFSDDALSQILVYANNSVKTQHQRGEDLQRLRGDLKNDKHVDTFYGYEVNQHLETILQDRVSSRDRLTTTIVGERLRLFEPQLASFGYNLHLITLPEFHVLAHNMYKLSKDFSEDGIKAYVTQVQRPERQTHLNDPEYTYYKHQSATGTGLEATFSEAVGSSDTNMLGDSTEADDLRSRIK